MTFYTEENCHPKSYLIHPDTSGWEMKKLYRFIRKTLSLTQAQRTQRKISIICRWEGGKLKPFSPAGTRNYCSEAAERFPFAVPSTAKGKSSISALSASLRWIHNFHGTAKPKPNRTAPFNSVLGLLSAQSHFPSCKLKLRMVHNLGSHTNNLFHSLNR